MSRSEPPKSDEPPRPHDLRLVPAAVAAWAAMSLATWGEPRWTTGIALAALLAGLVAWRRRAWRVLAVCAVLGVCLAAGGARAWAQSADPVAALGRERAVVEAQVEVSGEPRHTAATGTRPGYVVIPVLVREIDGRGGRWQGGASALVIAADDGSWGAAYGERLALVAAAEPPNPGDSVAAVLRARGAPTRLAAPPPWLGWSERVRAGLREAVAPEPRERAGLLPGLVLGDTSGVPAELDAAFKTTALTHLSAVSGSNLALLAAFVTTGARWLGIRGRALRVLTLGSIAAFVVLCRGEPSVLRAAAMGGVALAALGSGARDGAGLRNLSLAVLGLLFADPWLSRSWGFALSVAASAGIVVWGRRWSLALRQWAPGWVADTLAVPLAAQLATQPLITALSGSVSLVGLPANALAAPFVGPATVLGLAAAILAPLWLPGARLLACGGAWCAQLIIWIARWGAGLPGASLDWPATPPALVLISAACLLIGLVGHRVLQRRWLVLALAVGLVTTLLRGPVRPGWPPTAWSVVACDVGQGDGIVVRAGPGAAVVIDTGPDPMTMRRCLDGLGITSIPLLVLTHDHADHTGGLEAVLSRHLGLVLESPLASGARHRIEDSLVAAGAQPRAAEPGEELQIGAASWRTVSVGGGLLRDATGEGESSAENDASVIGLVAVDGIRVLVTGDAEPGGQDVAFSSGAALDCDVLKVAHHGSARQSPDLLAATHARVALISVGAANGYGHPTAKTLAAVRTLGMTVVRTDERGAIAIHRDRGELRVTSEHDAVPVAPKGRKK